MSTKLIKCRFCSWQHPDYYLSKTGKVVQGYRKLLYHVEDAHPEEYFELLETLNEELKRKEEQND